MSQCPYCKQDQNCLKLSQDMPQICPRCLVNTGLMQMSLPELSKLEEDLEVLLDARSRAAELKEVRDKALYTAHELEETGKTVVEQQKHQAQLRETVDHLRNTIESLECKLQQLDANVTTRFKAFAPFFLRD
jgi:hypothetical protein